MLYLCRVCALLAAAARSFTRSPSIAAVCRSLGFKRPLPVQSMYIFKQPNIGGEVVSGATLAAVYASPGVTATVGTAWLCTVDL